MHLRTRLFVWVGSLFAIAFALSYILEVYFTSSSLRVGEEHLKESIVSVNETQRQQLQSYIQEVVTDYQSNINALLARIQNYPPYRSAFVQKQAESSSDWLNASTMMVTNKWVDFFEVQRDGGRSVVIAVCPPPLERIQVHQTGEGINVLLGQNGEKLIGIPLVVQDFIPDTSLIQDPSNLNAVGFLVLFKPDTVKNFDLSKMQLRILNLSINPLEPFLRWIEVKSGKAPFAHFVEHFQVAQEALRKDPDYLEKISSDSVAAAVDNRFTTGLASDTRVVLDKLDQVGLIWGMTTLLASGPFGGYPFNPLAPVGMARVDSAEAASKVIFSNQVFYKTSFDNRTLATTDREAFKDTVEVFTAGEKGKYYFGNTLALTEPDQTTYITLGMDGLPIQQSISTIFKKITLFVVNDQILCALDKDSKTKMDIDLSQEEIHQMNQEYHGYVTIQGQKYYFIKMSIFSEGTCNFFLLTPAAEAFSFVKELDNDVQSVINKISWQMRAIAIMGLIIVLIILNDLSRKITRPISLLAQATTHVKKGHLEDADLPKDTLKFHDEIYTLYQSFNEMVLGLKEKEKVRAVLNKVVSPEIANEFLKQDPILGGEETVVTMLFADIRSFTRLTEKMTPSEVIQLLNTCMTKVSHVIDRYHGVIDKYVGDEVIALFGAPLKRAKSTEDALAAALDMVKALEEWNVERKRKGLDVVAMGFGVHVGRVVAGNMGAENRLNYTVLGSNVNLTSRICSVAKPMEILVTEAVYDTPGVKENFRIESVPSVELKGFSEEHKIYRLKGRMSL